MMDNEGTRESRCPKKAWWDSVRENMDSYGLSHVFAQDKDNGD